MGIRLNKVLTELNIGLQTAVDFLKNKKSLGEIRDDATPNTKISDEQYKALVSEFSSDKAVKTQAANLFPKKKEKKVEMAKTKTETQRQQFTPLGKIDLDSIGGKPKPAQQQPAVAEPAEKAESDSAPKAAAESPQAKVVAEEATAEKAAEPKKEPEPKKEEAAPVVEKAPEVKNAE